MRSGRRTHSPGTSNHSIRSLKAFQDLANNEVYRIIAVRTVIMAALVTLTDAILAFPIAYYMARIAKPRTRNLMVVAILMPLWASYLVKVYAWRTILQGNGFLEWLLGPLGLQGPGLDEIANSWLVFRYLWLPYMILPITLDRSIRARCWARPQLDLAADRG